MNLWKQIYLNHLVSNTSNFWIKKWIFIFKSILEENREQRRERQTKVHELWRKIDEKHRELEENHREIEEKLRKLEEREETERLNLWQSSYGIFF